MGYGATAKPQGDAEAPGDERRRRRERTGIAAAALCILLLVVAASVNARSRPSALVATSDVTLLACEGSRPRKSCALSAPGMVVQCVLAVLGDCEGATGPRAALFSEAASHERAVLLAAETPPPALDALVDLPADWDVVLFDAAACATTAAVGDGRWARCGGVAGGALAGTLAVRGSAAEAARAASLTGDAAELVVYALL